MPDHPILFSAPMVRAILAERKTMTRRVLKPQPEERPEQHGVTRWNVGDRLWVRENHYLTDDGHNERVIYAADGDAVKKHFDQLDSLGPSFPADIIERHKKLRPSIHMPRWASRITLAVESVRVERAQDITEDDAIAEGLTFDPMGGWSADTTNNALWRATPVEAFQALWHTIHKEDGPNGWSANPWLSVTTFRRVK